ncbi:MAG: iron-sulfur cluster assembly scaffold protein [Chloracidobacterium sp.]|nr:iron-sulfur cluster assembly scaffold protein [Chloracidobacterium sp.]
MTVKTACGDAPRVYVAMDGDQIADVAFHYFGLCDLKASASMMTHAVKGKTRVKRSRLRTSFTKWSFMNSTSRRTKRSRKLRIFRAF